MWKVKKGFGKMLTLLHFPDMQRQEENEQAPFEKFMTERHNRGKGSIHKLLGNRLAVSEV